MTARVVSARFPYLPIHLLVRSGQLKGTKVNDEVFIALADVVEYLLTGFKSLSAKTALWGRPLMAEMLLGRSGAIRLV